MDYSAAGGCAVTFLRFESLMTSKNSAITINSAIAIVVAPDLHDGIWFSDKAPSGATVVNSTGSGVGFQDAISALPDDSRFDEIIVVAHGVPARLQFGRDILDHDSILEGGVLYEGLTRHLAPQGQVTFQSCNLAAGEDGAYFIQTLAEHLGAGVAAATRAVGAKELGGPQVQISM